MSNYKRDCIWFSSDVVSHRPEAVTECLRYHLRIDDRTFDRNPDHMLSMSSIPRPFHLTVAYTTSRGDELGTTQSPLFPAVRWLLILLLNTFAVPVRSAPFFPL